MKQLFRRRFHGEATHTETGEELTLVEPDFENVDELDISGVYEHYKSRPDDRKLYYVDSVKRDNVSGEYLVLYTPLYKVDDFIVYARPLNMFTENVEVDGETVVRFRLIDSIYLRV